MESMISFFEAVTLIINLFSILILCLGVLICAKNLILIFMEKNERHEKTVRLQQAKTELGSFVLLGLEILIVADIIETIIRPTLEDIIRLAAIVAIRTVISFFLNKEILEAENASVGTKDGEPPDGS